MVTRSFGKKNCMQSSWTLTFFFWVAGYWEGFLVFSPLFPMCSHQVSKGFPEMFPMAPRFYGYLFAYKFNSHVYKLKSRGARLFLFCDWGRSIWLLEKKIILFYRAHELINMNRKLLTPVYKGGIRCTWFGKKYWFIATFAMAPLVNLQLETKLVSLAFGKSTTRDEIIIAGKGVPSNLTPYCNAMFFCGPFFDVLFDTSRGSIWLPPSIRVPEGLPCFSWSWSVYLTLSVLVILLAFAMGSVLTGQINLSAWPACTRYSMGVFLWHFFPFESYYIYPMLSTVLYLFMGYGPKPVIHKLRTDR
jgi:hypothetical protein